MFLSSSYLPFELGKQYSTTPQEDKRVHYPHLLAPPTLRTANLPSYRPARYLNPILWTFATLGRKEREQQLREYMWKTELPCNPSRTLTPDSVTDYTYDYDNRLTEVSLPTNSDTVEYTYDAMGRRLTKKFTYHNGANTDVTTYKYHYIGGQITEIEIDSIRNPGEGQTVLRNEEVKIHLGANSQPISYEWVKHVGESTTSATYYYHYDIHGNVLKVTDSSENVKITYTYDVLGKILTETNPDSVLNFFTFRGASQTIWDSEVGMYYSGGFYRPDTGTALQGTGAPVLTNPASGAMISAMAQVNKINRQMAIQARRAATTAGSASGGSPGGFSPPAGPSDGFAHTGNQGPPPTTETVEPTPTLTTCDINGVAVNSDFPILQGMFECDCGSELCSQCKGQRKHRTHNPSNDTGGMGNDVIGGGGGGPEFDPVKIREWLKFGTVQVALDPVFAESQGLQSDDFVDENGDGYDDKTGYNKDGYDKNGFNKKGYNSNGEFNPAFDRDPSDDGKQYVWAIRDGQGNIVACKVKGLMNDNDTNSTVYVYEVGSDGLRTKPPKLQGKSGAVANWNRIMDSVEAGDSTVGMWDSYGRATSGCIAMQLNDEGEARGVFVSPGKAPVVKTGYGADFGMPNGEVGVGAISTAWRDKKPKNKNSEGDADYEVFWRFESNDYYNSYDNVMGQGYDLSQEDPDPYVGPWRWIDSPSGPGGEWTFENLP